MIAKPAGLSITRRSPYGERGLKFRDMLLDDRWLSRSPYGERGLKYNSVLGFLELAPSLSLRRAWIEITTVAVLTRTGNVALLTESVD